MTTGDPRVVAYLSRLEEAAGGLRSERRAELVAEIRDHIASRLSDLGPPQPGEDPVDSTLSRLGEPEEIVAAATDETDAVETGRISPWPALQRRSGGLEAAALVLLLLGGFVFVVGWIPGVVLLWMSSRWRVWEKVLGTLVWPGGLALPVLFGGLIASSGGQACVSSPEPGGMTTICEGGSSALGTSLFALSLLAPLAVTAYLGIRAFRRRALG